MFIVKWEGTPPPDKARWIAILRETLASELGSYRVVFTREGEEWRLSLDWREDDRAREEGLVANSPESVAYNLYVNLTEAGKLLKPAREP